jgi:hypothetical protein
METNSPTVHFCVPYHSHLQPVIFCLLGWFLDLCVSCVSSNKVLYVKTCNCLNKFTDEGEIK